ncbi:MAG: hypothetical protein PF481_09620 [Bacteroidales bacterium]|jgi:hypothetical protein|nr:hypothetical protein [Bacteroidales bacterium]
MRKTKYENRYFDLAENVHYEIDEETGIFSFENLNKKLYELLENIEAEMLENSTILTDKNRQLYYERIKKRAANMDIDYFFVNDKPGQFTHTPEGEMRINSEIEMEQIIGLGKVSKMHNGEECPMGQQAVEERKKILKKHKHLIVQIINKCFPDLHTPQQDTKQKLEQDTPISFEELFYNTDLISPCIEVLKALEPPLIDTENNYIGKLKGIVCVWIDEMQRQGIIKHYSDRKIFASLIPQKIKRFSIDESMFGKYQSKAENLYRTDIKTKISKIKLSQNSQ